MAMRLRLAVVMGAALVMGVAQAQPQPPAATSKPPVSTAPGAAPGVGPGGARDGAAVRVPMAWALE